MAARERIKKILGAIGSTAKGTAHNFLFGAQKYHNRMNERMKLTPEGRAFMERDTARRKRIKDFIMRKTGHTIRISK